MAEAAEQKVFDLHFTGLCLFALWADGVLSSNERDYLTDLLWINLSDDDGLKYDFEFGARSRIANAIEVINETYPELNSNRGGDDTDEVAAALVAVFTKVEDMLDDSFSAKETEKILFFTELQKQYLGLGLADGKLDKREQNVLTKLYKSFPSRFRFLESFKQGKDLLDKEEHRFIALGNLRPGKIFEKGLVGESKSKTSTETVHPAERLADKTQDEAKRPIHKMKRKDPG